MLFSVGPTAIDSRDLKVGAHDPIFLELLFKFFVCTMEYVGVRAILSCIQLFRDEFFQVGVFGISL